ncbi:MAG: hypothetical protein M3019_07625 [Candidatus Dormibacteraeota bacterium]|nr:hypothetical protein [Candidatus Dormibacteraeota bacterium]
MQRQRLTEQSTANDSSLLELGDHYARVHRTREAVPVSHHLAGNPLFTQAAIADLADALPAVSVVSDKADQALVSPDAPPRGSEPRPGDVIRNLDTHRSWLTLLNIEQEPAYRDLMNACLDEVAAVVDLKRGDTRRRAGFIFVSSPKSVTPAHFDIEHSLLLQLSGQKQVTVGRFADDQTRLRERERYWDGALGRVEGMPVVVEAHDLTPGMGIYLPPICPHWVHNGDQVSISMTLTYFTSQSERDQQIEAFNAKLRKRGMHPAPPGQSQVRDVAKASVMRAWGARRRFFGNGIEVSGSH